MGRAYSPTLTLIDFCPFPYLFLFDFVRCAQQIPYKNPEKTPLPIRITENRANKKDMSHFSAVYQALASPRNDEA